MSGKKLTKRNDKGLPKNPRIGQLWYDSWTRTMRQWNGDNWVTEVRPGDIARVAGAPIRKVLMRLTAELGYAYTVPVDQVTLKRVTRHGLRYQFTDKYGASILAGKNEMLCTICEVDELADAGELQVEISSRAFEELHGERLIILSIGKADHNG